jgi:cell filamentation protein
MKNKLGITSADELAKAEADFASVRTFELSKNPVAGNFDFEHLKAIHRTLFQDVYDWAGVPRDVNMSKGDTYFLDHQEIKPTAAKIFSCLAKENHLAGLSKRKFSERAAFYLGEIYRLHPFREGNSRTQREFVNNLARQNGYYIEWRKTDGQELREACRLQAFENDPEASGLANLICRSMKDLPEEVRPSPRNRVNPRAPAP